MVLSVIMSMEAVLVPLAIVDKGAEKSALQEPMDILVLRSADVKMEHVRQWMAGVIVQ